MSALDRSDAPREGVAPDLLTVREAMVVLRIGRTTLYEQAGEFLASDGVAGIPVVKIGKQLRFPRVALEELIGYPISWPPIDTTSSDEAEPVADDASRHCSTRAERRTDSPRLFSV